MARLRGACRGCAGRHAGRGRQARAAGHGRAVTARRRDVRRFGPGPYVLGLRRDLARWGFGFPYDVPAVAAVDSLSLDAPVTLLAGDNGTGKSTIVEAIAEAIGFAAQGGELERSGELPAVPRRVFGE